MQIKITGHQMDITDALRERAHDALQKVNGHTDQTIGNVHVVLDSVKQRHNCNITLHIGKRHYSAKDDSDNMYTAIDNATDKILRQLDSDKSREKESRHHLP